MYYQEKWIDGKLMYRLLPDGDWNEFTLDMYAKRVIEMETEILSLESDILMLRGYL